MVVGKIVQTMFLHRKYNLYKKLSDWPLSNTKYFCFNVDNANKHKFTVNFHVYLHFSHDRG